MSYQHWLELPRHLQERVHVLQDRNAQPHGEFVLYWAHHALRAHQNPALDTAAHAARLLDLPLLIYQGLGGNHRYNADRHHWFILESARDFHRQLHALGQRLRFHLPPDPHQPGPLRELVRRSALVVSELFPAPPFPRWYRALSRRAPSVPWLLVDTACVFPMPLGRQHHRAFAFRRAHGEEQERRLMTSWPARDSLPAPFDGDPGFTEFDLESDRAGPSWSCGIDPCGPAGTPGSLTRARYPGSRRNPADRDKPTLMPGFCTPTIAGPLNTCTSHPTRLPVCWLKPHNACPEQSRS